MANDNVIYFLFYDVHMPIILDIVSFVLGFVLVFFTYKINRNLFWNVDRWNDRMYCQR